MRSYVLRRLALLIGIVFVISVGSFFMIHLLPGDLATVILGAANTPHNRKILYAQLGLDKGLLQQYLTWMGHVLQGDLGHSFVSRESINSIIGHAIPIDIEMIVLSQIVAFSLAIPLAMKAARKPNGIFDRLANGFSFGMLSVPSFILVVYAVLFIALILRVPNTGPASFTRMPGFGMLFDNPAEYFDTWRLNLLSMVIPTLTGAIGAFVIYFRTLRSDLIATLQEEFITMARSKGLRRRRILWRHAFRPSSVALLSTAGINIGNAIAGGFVTQFLLAIPGLGATLIAAITTQDYILIQGIVFVVATAVVSINFLIDFITTLIDPRIARD